ncbi:MAG: DUF4190 domain-containing protein [Streptosporangiales bacterium]
MTQQVWNNAAYARAGYLPRSFGQYQEYKPTASVAYPPYGYPHQPATNGLAIAALVLGVVSALGAVMGVPLFVLAVLGAPAGVVGPVLGVVARSKVRQRQQQGAGMALAGIITAVISLAIDLLLGVLFVAQILTLLF